MRYYRRRWSGLISTKFTRVIYMQYSQRSSSSNNRRLPDYNRLTSNRLLGFPLDNLFSSFPIAMYQLLDIDKGMRFILYWGEMSGYCSLRQSFNSISNDGNFLATANKKNCCATDTFLLLKMRHTENFILFHTRYNGMDFWECKYNVKNCKQFVCF